MISRKYTRKVEIYKTIPTPDGYGGNTISDDSLGFFWAEIKQLSSFKDNTLGNAEIKTIYSFKVRANPNISPFSNDLSVIYKGNRYVVNDITYADELFREVNLVAHGS